MEQIETTRHPPSSGVPSGQFFLLLAPVRFLRKYICYPTLFLSFLSGSWPFPFPLGPSSLNYCIPQGPLQFHEEERGPSAFRLHSTGTKRVITREMRNGISPFGSFSIPVRSDDLFLVAQCNGRLTQLTPGYQ